MESRDRNGPITERSWSSMAQFQQGNVPWAALVFCTLRLPCEVPNNTEHLDRNSLTDGHVTLVRSPRDVFAARSLVDLRCTWHGRSSQIGCWHARSKFRLAQLACLCGDVTWPVRCWCDAFSWRGVLVSFHGSCSSWSLLSAAPLAWTSGHSNTVMVLQAATPSICHDVFKNRRQIC